MAGRSTRWSSKLYFWDVPAALVGFAVAAVLQKVPLGAYSVFWWGAPLAFVAIRRVALPQLTPADDPSKPPASIGRRIGAYACLVSGGFIALVSGAMFYAAATSETKPELAWPLLVVLGFGGTIAALGIRWLT